MRSSVSSLTLSGDEPAAQRELRIDLAAAFRWFARLEMVEAVANHFSVAVNAEGTRFLINPCRRHFSRVTASSLLLLDAHDQTTLQRAATANQFIAAITFLSDFANFLGNQGVSTSQRSQTIDDLVS